MRPYATVSPLFWTGTTGKKLRKDADAQRVAFYLMTSPHSHQSGMYYLPLMYLCHEVGITQEGACKALLSLSDDDFCRYDEASEWVWVCEMAAWQIGSELSEGDKRCKGLQHYLTTLPTLPFLDEFVARYRADYHLKVRALEGAPSEQSGTRTEQEQIGPDGADAPPPAKTSESKKRPSRRCPSDFEVTEDLRVWASTECPGVNIDQQTKAFRDYEFRNSHTDWKATWRTWMRKAHESRGKQPAPPQRSGAFPR
jgi:hypothetical protein